MKTFRPRPLLVALLSTSALALALASPARAEEPWVSLFNGKDLTGWKFRNPAAKNLWVVCDNVAIDPSDEAKLVPVGKGGGPGAALLCGGDGRSSDIMTTVNFGDYELHLEFTVPKGSNSGVYNRGLFEIQIFDSFGVKTPAFHDCGALYERAKPAENLAKAPGEWQTYDITLKGKKLSLTWNGQVVYRDKDVRFGETDKAAFERLTAENVGKAPALRVHLEEKDGKYVGNFGDGGTRSGLDGPDRPGPILFQGDHGPVAFRNIRIRRLD